MKETPVRIFEFCIIMKRIWFQGLFLDFIGEVLVFFFLFCGMGKETFFFEEML